MSSGGSQTTTASQEPWEGAQPYLTDTMNRARSLYNQGVGQQYYGGDTVVPFSPTTQAGMGVAGQIASQGNPLLDRAMGTTYSMQDQSPLRGMNTANQAAAGQGGFGMRPDAQHMMHHIQSQGIQTAPGVSGVQQMASGNDNMRPDAAAVTQGISRTGVEGLSGFTTLGRTSSGQMLNGNPHLDRTFDQMADRVASRTNAAMGLAGRTGSGAHTDVMADSLGDLANDVYGQNYQMERQRQLQSAQGLMSSDMQNRGLRLSAAGQLEGMDRARDLDRFNASSDLMGRELQNRGLRLSAASQLEGADLARDSMRLTAAGQLMGNDLSMRSQAMQAAGMAPMLSGARYADSDVLMRLGAMQEGKAGEYVQDRINRHNFSQSAPWDALMRYGNFAMGIGGMGGQSMSTAPRQGGGMSGALGGGLSGAAIGGQFGGPYGAAIGGGIGGLLGLFG